MRIILSSHSERECGRKFQKKKHVIAINVATACNFPLSFLLFNVIFFSIAFGFLDWVCVACSLRLQFIVFRCFSFVRAHWNGFANKENKCSHTFSDWSPFIKFYYSLAESNFHRNARIHSEWESNKYFFCRSKHRIAEALVANRVLYRVCVGFAAMKYLPSH